ncbi:hypothetical protein RM549_09235 [Salegentibacter sp. F188]|uniref:Endonuclease/exonuclease/phosphatase domain-containing protein n=1 Tax=Autumnicola patrickiae TaxID=3075591 RepID=A0ABU3E206_9FLAO|nr:hypothetical protein [Salegentibacter sp. F188]MDT0689965.1 hypothetical protein [Salegentibacter sp. F188]
MNLNNFKSFSKILFTIIFLFAGSNFLLAQVKICSWNLQNLGKSKSDFEIEIMAQTIKNFDVVAIQEVVAGYGGPQAVARLVDELNRTGAKWNYQISEATESTPYATERYAFLWKTSNVQSVGRASLIKTMLRRSIGSLSLEALGTTGKNLL